MARKPRSPSIDTMLKYFLEGYGVCTHKDFDNIAARLDSLESRIKAIDWSPPPPPPPKKKTAKDKVLEAIRHYEDGADIADIFDYTGFNEKKIRNTVFSLSKAGKIERISRGIYIASPK
jgi:hypothetical protein